MEIIGIPILELALNPFIAVLELVALVFIVVVLERWFNLRKVKFDTKKFAKDIKSSLAEGGVEKAVKLCESEHHPLANVIVDGLRNAELGRDDVYDALEEGQIRERGILEKRVGILSIIAFIGPLLGLLGTVVGIIQAFSTMAAVGGADPTAMLSGIAIALLTTAVGIIIAVPAAITFGMFSGRVDAISSELEMGSKELVIALSEHIWKTKNPDSSRDRKD
ncbi:MotA/TolQ/ExbB proton channel family protein [candidate division WOR-3 bacterium]|nr:MotA/TolQ/ExbB proton channel family protein [candidate division WOR-3 bacterium]